MFKLIQMPGRSIPKALLFVMLAPTLAFGQSNPLWTEAKVRNYLPHMTWPEVEKFLERSDMVIFPVGSVEQHGPHLPLGTDYFNGVERAKLVAQRTDVLVAPILLPGQSPYHMEFPGTITLSAETLQRVYVEAAQSLIRHGFKRFLILNAHGGNRAICQFIVDRINQETEGIAVDLGSAAAPYQQRRPQEEDTPGGPLQLDRHAGVGETANSLFLIPTLVQQELAVPATITMPDHMESMVPQVLAGDPAATTVFLAEGLKARETGKGTSAREMSTTGVWGVRDPREATAEEGRIETERFVAAAVRFIERWRELRPQGGS
jgi:creatinine amidohydrolase